MQAITEQQFLAGLRLVGRIPESNDVVEGLVDCRNFHELHRALAPSCLRLDPQAGPAVIKHAIILVVIEIAITLQQPETARILVRVGIEAQRFRIHEGTPDPFAGAGPQGKAVGIMDFRTPVIRHAAVILAVLVHAGQRRDPQAFDRFSRVQRGIDVHHKRLAGPDVKPVSAGNAGGIQQRVNRQRCGFLCRPFDPECPEHRKFLGTRHAGIDGQPACGQAILFLFPYRAEITGAQKNRDVACQVGVEMHPETGKTEIRRKVLALQSALAVVEHRRIVGYFPGLAVRHRIHVDGSPVEQPEMEELHLKPPAFFRPQRMIVAVTDGLVLVPVQARHGFGDRLRRRAVRRLRQRAGAPLEPGIVERLRFARDSRQRSGGKSRRKRQPHRRKCRHDFQCFAPLHIRTSPPQG